MTLPRRLSFLALVFLSVAHFPGEAMAQSAGEDEVILGIQLRVGGRFDNVRMCVASPAGARGGPAADITFFVEAGLSEDISLTVNLPVFRPIMFAAAFQMLQFEPQVTLNFRHRTGSSTDVIYGPSLGVTLHYGPSYESGRSGEQRGASFFALGPKVGFYVGADFTRPEQTFNFQLGLHPYISPIFPVGDAPVGNGVIVGGTLDGLFRFDPSPD